jgi:TolB protein
MDTARADIHIMDADGSHVVNLTQHPDEDNYPVWSADGRTIYFVSLRDGTAQVYAVDASGGKARRLTNSSGHDLSIRPQPVPASAKTLAASTSADLAKSH